MRTYPVSTTKSLGILIDDNMARHNHIDKLSKKIAPGIGAIKRIKPFVSPQYYITSTMPWYNPISITVVLSGELRQNALRKITKTAESCCSHFDFLLLWCWCWVLVTTTWLERPDCPASSSSSVNGVRVVTKISSCRVNTTSRRGIKQLGVSFGSIFLLFSFESSRGPCS